MPPPALPTSEQVDSKPKKRLDTPLAAMLPSKYENTDVTELFPDFRHDKVNLTKTESKFIIMINRFFGFRGCSDLGSQAACRKFGEAFAKDGKRKSIKIAGRIPVRIKTLVKESLKAGL